MEVSEDCVICKQPIVGGTGVTLGEKGSSIINRASAARIDTINAIPGQQIHEECRRKYCNPQQIAKTVKLGKQEVQPARLVLRSAEQQFNFCTTVSSVVNQPHLEKNERVQLFSQSGQWK